MPKKLTQDEFIRRSSDIHNNKYDYSKVNYTTCDKKVCIICPEHGEFWQRAIDHMRGCGCCKCYGNKRLTTSEFIEKAIKKQGNKYDYSKVNYINNSTKVCIICPKHGEFWQTPNDHLTGYGCPKCVGLGMTTSDVVQRFRKVHGDIYDYSKTKYDNMHKKICIICPEHGEFWQTPCNHVNGCGCPFCNCGKKSKMEDNIRIELIKNNIIFEQQKTFKWLKYEKNMFLDFYIDKYKIAIEVQGGQHFYPIKKFGGQKEFELIVKRDEAKRKLCEEHNIKMFYITKKNNSLDNVISYINEASIKS